MLKNELHTEASSESRFSCIIFLKRDVDSFRFMRSSHWHQQLNNLLPFSDLSLPQMPAGWIPRRCRFPPFSIQTESKNYVKFVDEFLFLSSVKVSSLLVLSSCPFILHLSCHYMTTNDWLRHNSRQFLRRSPRGKRKSRNDEAVCQLDAVVATVGYVA